MKTITISDDDYRDIQKLSRAARLSTKEFMEEFLFSITRMATGEIDEFLRGQFANSEFVYGRKADAAAIAKRLNRVDQLGLTYKAEYYRKRGLIGYCVNSK